VLPTSDWDLVLAGVPGTRANMQRIAGELAARGAVRRTEVIDSARVPIVKAWEAASGIQLDVSFESAAGSGLATRDAILALCDARPPLRPLVVLLKYFLLQRGLNDTYSGGVGSFALTLMAAHAAAEAAAVAAAAGEARPDLGLPPSPSTTHASASVDGNLPSLPSPPASVGGSARGSFSERRQWAAPPLPTASPPGAARPLSGLEALARADL
jgi:hypothetical protein